MMTRVQMFKVTSSFSSVLHSYSEKKEGVGFCLATAEQ